MEPNLRNQGRGGEATVGAEVDVDSGVHGCICRRARDDW